MKVLGIDPGAERSGWAVVDKKDGQLPTLVEAGFVSFPRLPGELFQEYKCRLIYRWVYKTDYLIDEYNPDIIALEIVPAVGGGNFVVATQSYLAHTQATVVHTIATLRGYDVVQIGATTVKANIGGSKSASKVQVRNGVYEILPDVKTEKEVQWKVQFREGIYDECDALAIALTHLEYKRKRHGSNKGKTDRRDSQAPHTA